MAKKECDAVVVGAGPGGYVAAVRLAQLGLQTVVVDKEKLGGVCLNWGCIPSKALIHAGKLVEAIRHAGDLGIKVEFAPEVDLAKLVSWKDGVVDRLTGGVGQLMKTNGVEVIMGTARLTGANQVTVAGNDGQETTVVAKQGILLATGSRSIQIPGFEFDGEVVHNNRSILALAKPPKRLCVIGGGVIGLELGQFFQKIGAELTVVELMDQLLPGVDKELVKVVQRGLKKAGVTLHLKSKAKSLKKVKGGVEVVVETPNKGDVTVECDAVLVTVGRRPNSEDLGLEQVGVATERGFVQVNERLETSVKGIYAIGDLVGPPLLAHKASKEGIVAAEVIAGDEAAVYDVIAMPGAIFTDPEIATVGLTEAEAREQGYEVVAGQFPFVASGRALSTGETQGHVKLVADAKTHAILGGGIVGPEASNLIAEVALAMELGGTLEDIASTVHAHPTLPECVMEAAEDALGHAIHIPPKKKKT